jgi:hypothetical protein
LFYVFECKRGCLPRHEKAALSYSQDAFLAAFLILFDKIHSVYENHVLNSGRRGPYLHTGYILFQLLRLLGKDVRAEEFNTLHEPFFAKKIKKRFAIKNVGARHNQ